MAIRLSKRLVNSTVVLEIKGRITLGESSSMLRNAVHEIITVDKPTGLILDISGLSYIDSSGIGELVHVFQVLKRSGCDLFLCHPRIKLIDLLQITRLYALFNATATVEDALSGMQSKQYRFLCPVASCQTWSLWQPAQDSLQVCVRCSSQYHFNLRGSGEMGGHIEEVRMATYPGHMVSFTPGDIPIISTVGPVDLFVSNILERAWLTMAAPDRSAIFDLTAAAEITGRAVRQLLEIVKNTGSGRGGLILLQPSHPVSSGAHAAIYTDMEKAREMFRGKPGPQIRTAFMH